MALGVAVLRILPWFGDGEYEDRRSRGPSSKIELDYLDDFMAAVNFLF